MKIQVTITERKAGVSSVRKLMEDMGYTKSEAEKMHAWQAQCARDGMSWFRADCTDEGPPCEKLALEALSRHPGDRERAFATLCNGLAHRLKRKAFPPVFWRVMVSESDAALGLARDLWEKAERAINGWQDFRAEERAERYARAIANWSGYPTVIETHGKAAPIREFLG